jgi:hypothetical protein
MQSKAAVNLTPGPAYPLRPLHPLRFYLRIVTAEDAVDAEKRALHDTEWLTALSWIIYYFRAIFNLLQEGDDAPVRWYDTKSRNIPARRWRYV